MHKIKVRWVIEKDNKIFLVREINKHFFYLPWGTLDENESFRDCLKREILEEFWIEAVVWELVSIREFKNEEWFYLDIWFKIENVCDFENINKSKASHSFEYYWEWFYSFDELEDCDVRPKDLEKLLNEKISLL